MTILPRTGPFSASCALDRTSWYHRGKSSAWGVSTFAIGRGWYRPPGAAPSAGAGGDRERGGGPADLVERAVVQLVAQRRLARGAAVGVVVAVVRPRQGQLAVVDRGVDQRGRHRAGDPRGRLAQRADQDRLALVDRPHLHGVLGAVGPVGAHRVDHRLLGAVTVEIAVVDVVVDLEARQAAEVEQAALPAVDRDAPGRCDAEPVRARRARLGEGGEVDVADGVVDRGRRGGTGTGGAFGAPPQRDE